MKKTATPATKNATPTPSASPMQKSLYRSHFKSLVDCGAAPQDHIDTMINALGGSQSEEKKVDTWTTRSAACAKLGISLPTLDKLRTAGLVKFKVVGERLVRISSASIDDFLNGNAAAGKEM